MSFQEFESINKGYNSIFNLNKLTIGVIVPLENYANTAIPSMKEHLEMVQLVESFGFKAIWLRDIPFNVPSFRDAGQIYDPFVYLGYLAGQTKEIALGIASVILPIRHPAHVAKAIASIDDLSNGRVLLGVASGDRKEEYPALNISYDERSKRFRESYEYIKEVWKETPIFDNNFGTLSNEIDMLPKPIAKKVPMLITGASQQTEDWMLSNTEGWITYTRKPKLQRKFIKSWRNKAQELGCQYNKPFIQPLYINLVKNKDQKPTLIHLGYKVGSNYLKDTLKDLEEAGVNHVILNLRLNQSDAKNTLEQLAKEILPEFS